MSFSHQMFLFHFFWGNYKLPVVNHINFRYSSVTSEVMLVDTVGFACVVSTALLFWKQHPSFPWGTEATPHHFPLCCPALSGSTTSWGWSYDSDGDNDSDPLLGPYAGSVHSVKSWGKVHSNKWWEVMLELLGPPECSHAGMRLTVHSQSLVQLAVL